MGIVLTLMEKQHYKDTSVLNIDGLILVAICYFVYCWIAIRLRKSDFKLRIYSLDDKIIVKCTQILYFLSKLMRHH